MFEFKIWNYNSPSPIHTLYGSKKKIMLIRSLALKLVLFDLETVLKYQSFLLINAEWSPRTATCACPTVISETFRLKRYRRLLKHFGCSVVHYYMVRCPVGLNIVGIWISAQAFVVILKLFEFSSAHAFRAISRSSDMRVSDTWVHWNRDRLKSSWHERWPAETTSQSREIPKDLLKPLPYTPHATSTILASKTNDCQVDCAQQETLALPLLSQLLTTLYYSIDSACFWRGERLLQTWAHCLLQVPVEALSLWFQ